LFVWLVDNSVLFTYEIIRFLLELPFQLLMSLLFFLSHLRCLSFSRGLQVPDLLMELRKLAFGIVLLDIKPIVLLSKGLSGLSFVEKLIL
jgi:hypothetical protein